MNVVELHRNLDRYFDLSELETLCFDLNIDHNNLSGRNKSDKCRELITYLQRRGRLNELIEYCVQQRPNINWHELSSVVVSSLNFEKDAKISILFLAADPADVTRLRLGEESREIQEKLQLAKLREQFILHQRTSVRPVDISQAMLDLQPKIVHFSGHGSATGELYFEDMLGNAYPVKPDALAALFEQFANQVKCVVLNACFSKIQADSIVKHIDYVIGMSQAIGDKAAIAFSIGFYQALGAGRTVEEAYKLGIVQIRLQNIPEHLTPQILKRYQQ